MKKKEHEPLKIENMTDRIKKKINRRLKDKAEKFFHKVEKRMGNGERHKKSRQEVQQLM